MFDTELQEINLLQARIDHIRDEIAVLMAPIEEWARACDDPAQIMQILLRLPKGSLEQIILADRIRALKKPTL
jgi:hypothetical protein